MELDEIYYAGVEMQPPETTGLLTRSSPYLAGRTTIGPATLRDDSMKAVFRVYGLNSIEGCRVTVLRTKRRTTDEFSTAIDRY